MSSGITKQAQGYGGGNGTITINSTANNMFAYGSQATWANTSITSDSSTPSLIVTGNAKFEGDIEWQGRNLGKLLEKIEDRLAILADPDPKKLEKHEALKKAYNHYKLMEKLIGED